MRGFASDGDGYYGSLSCRPRGHRRSAWTACSSAARPSSDLGGFEEAYSRQFHDFDLCLRLRSAAAEHRSAPLSRGRSSHTTEARRRSDFDVLDRALFVDRWYERLEAGDPYYNGGFFRAAADYSLSPFGGDALELAMRESVG